MNKKISGILIILLLSNTFSGESKILKKVSKYLPSVTEVAYLSNIINIYYQVSQSVRATNKLVNDINQAKEDWEDLKQMTEDLYTGLNNLRNIDPYNMDTWASTLRNADNLLTYELSDLIHEFSMIEYNSLYASERFLTRIDDASKYDIRLQAKKSTAEKYFIHPEYKKVLDNFYEVVKYNVQDQITYLEQKIQNQTNELSTISNPEYASYIKSQIIDNQKKLQTLGNKFNSYINNINKKDSVIAFTMEIITSNLMEIQYTYEDLQSFERVANNLNEAWYKLKSGDLSSRPKINTSGNVDFAMDISSYDSKNPNKVSAPHAPVKQVKQDNKKSKRDPSEQDILTLQNASDYLSLQQETKLRDIESYKAFTFAFITALEAMNQADSEMETLGFCHQSMGILLRFRNGT